MATPPPLLRWPPRRVEVIIREALARQGKDASWLGERLGVDPSLFAKIGQERKVSSQARPHAGPQKGEHPMQRATFKLPLARADTVAEALALSWVEAHELRLAVMLSHAPAGIEDSIAVLFDPHPRAVLAGDARHSGR